MRHIQKRIGKFCQDFFQESSNPFLPQKNLLEAFMQEVPNFPPKGMKVDLDKLEDEILLFEVENVIINLKLFFRRVRIHFYPKKIYGTSLLFFTRFMPTNGFAQPFVGIISFFNV